MDAPFSCHHEARAGTLRRMKKQVAVTASFAEVVGLIERARQRAYQRVNAELVRLYWQLGQYISQ